MKMIDCELGKKEHSKEACARSQAALEDILYVIGGKWKLKIISALHTGGASRFNQLQQTVTGISARILSKELKELELNGLIKRNVYVEIPVIVQYEVTPYSGTLGPVLLEMIKWGEAHKMKIRES